MQTQAIQLAMRELNERQFAVTRQFLAVQAVTCGSDGAPRVARVDDVTEPGAWRIYFPIQDECHHLVVVVRQDLSGRLVVAWVYWEAEIRIYLRIESETCSVSEIEKIIGLRSMPEAASHPTHGKKPCWRFEPQKHLPGGFEEKLAKLLELLAPHAERIAARPPDCRARLAIVYCGWGGDPQFGGLHLSENAVRQINQLRAEIDIDLYSSGPSMAEDDA